MNKTKRICIITRDIIGPVKNGGIGTAFHNLAELLAIECHKVTILFVRDNNDYDNDDEKTWIDYYEKKCISLVILDAEEKFRSTYTSDVRHESYSCYMWLKENAFDIMHFHDWRGIGYYSLLAKYEGLAFSESLMCVQLHSPVLWHIKNDARAVVSHESIEADYMEKKSAELADCVISPSLYMKEHYERNGCNLPKETKIIQNVVHTDAKKGAIGNVVEIVFFGRLEYRKGLGIFCSALAEIDEELMKNISITFIGKESKINGDTPRKFIEDTMGYKNDWMIINDFDSHSAGEYLKQNGRLAVIASKAENSPYTVLECIAGGISFIASDVGGIAELIAEKDRQKALFTPQIEKLKEKLEEIIKNGCEVLSPAISFDKTKNAWLKLHSNAALLKRAKSTVKNYNKKPLVSVCITHFNRPDLLKRTLSSVKAQDYDNFEVILVDDGSTDENAISFLKDVEKDFKKNKWKLVRQENKYLGAARNNAAKHAKGKYILFMDDDNYAKTNEISSFVRVAEHTDADVLTCVAEHITDDNIDFINNDTNKPKLHIPIGGCTSLGIYENGFGDANSLIKRESFNSIGGFSEYYGIGLEDSEFFAKALLNGYKLDVIPEALFFYRENDSGMISSTSSVLNGFRAIRPYLKKYPEIASSLLLARGIYLELPAIHCDYKGLEESYAGASLANKELFTSNSELTEANKELTSTNNELFEARKQLMKMNKTLDKQNAVLNERLDMAGEKAVDFAIRMNARGITRKFMNIYIYCVTKVLDIASFLNSAV